MNRTTQIISVLLLLLSSCSSDDSPSSGTSGDPVDPGSGGGQVTTKVGKEAFLPDKNANFEVIFFDVDNVINEKGDIDENHSCVSDKQGTNNNADCYLVKSGNTEILFDCGNQLRYGTEDNRTKNFCTNIYRKIITYCQDGVLDYLIVTHADSDHIVNFTIEGGLFDSVIDPEKWLTQEYKRYTNEDAVTNIYGEPATQLTSIGNIIDFDSYRVRFNSTNEAIDEDYRFIVSNEYRTYQKKRDQLITVSNGKTKYCPASYLFSQVTGDTTNPESHNFHAIPTDYISFYNDAGTRLNFKTILGSDYYNHYKNNYFDSSILPSIENGLNEIQAEDGTIRYTFDIDLEKNTKLRILYNWYYDSYYAPNSTQYGYYNERSSLSQPHNNISVCSLIQCNKSKLLLTGDIGTYGENALINYYNGTDVLKSISCYKASHHGSTSKRRTADGEESENSKALFDLIGNKGSTTKVICTIVAQPNTSFFKEDVTDSSGKNEIQLNQSFHDSLTGVATLSKNLFENMSGINYDLYATQIVTGIQYEETKYRITNMPFYGDIHVKFTSTSSELTYDFGGEISTYIKRTVDVDDPIYKFKTNKQPIEELEWTRKIELL